MREIFMIGKIDEIYALRSNPQSHYASHALSDRYVARTANQAIAQESAQVVDGSGKCLPDVRGFAQPDRTRHEFGIGQVIAGACPRIEC